MERRVKLHTYSYKETERDWNCDASCTCTVLPSTGLKKMNQGCTNPGRQVAMASKYFTVTPNIFGPSVCHVFHVTLEF